VSAKQALKLRPFEPREFVNNVVRPLHDAFVPLDVADLRAVRDHIAQLNETNCWWLVYDCRSALAFLVNEELRQRDTSALDAPAAKVQP